MKTIALCIAALLFSAKLNAIPIAQWTFETSAPTTAGPHVAESGTQAGVAAASSVGLGTISSPAGNGSAHSFSGNGWNIGDYFQFHISTIGFDNITISWDQTGSSTGPRDFILQYSTDGSSFNSIGSAYQVLLTDWVSGSFHTGFTFAPSLTAIASSIANQPDLYFRIVDNSTTAIGGGAVQTSGTDRIDNFTVNGTSVPESSPGFIGWVVIVLLLAVGSWRLNSASSSNF